MTTVFEILFLQTIFNSHVISLQQNNKYDKAAERFLRSLLLAGDWRVRCPQMIYSVHPGRWIVSWKLSTDGEIAILPPCIRLSTCGLQIASISNPSRINNRGKNLFKKFKRHDTQAYSNSPSSFRKTKLVT